MNINPKIQMNEKLFLHKNSDSKRYVFPITGLDIDDKIEIGNTIFFKKGMDIDELMPKIPDNLYCGVSTLAYVDLKNIPKVWKENCDLTSIALQTLKQSIGVIYLAYFEENDRNIIGEKRIVISDLNMHEVDEGLVPFVTEKRIENISKSSDALNMKMNSKILMNIKNIRPVFFKASEMSTEMDCKILKIFETLYYLNNEIYSLERILKISAILNFVFIEGEDDKKEFNNVAANIKQLFDYYGLDTWKKLNLEDKKLNNNLNKIYSDIRSRYSHGKIDLYKEFTVLEETQYYLFKIVLYELLKLLINNEEVKKIKSSKDLNEFITEIRMRYKNNT